jgi:hypothetical protein
MNIKHTVTALALGALSLSSFEVNAQQENYFRAIGTPHAPKVEIAWNRYYSAEGLWDLMKKIAVAHPKIAKIESIGKSVEGRDILTLTITDFAPMRCRAGNFRSMWLGT